MPAVITEVNAGAPNMWASLTSITAPTLLIGGGEASHIPQDKLCEVARHIPRCTVATIPAGHHVHKGEPSQFVDRIEEWLGRT